MVARIYYKKIMFLTTVIQLYFIHVKLSKKLIISKNLKKRRKNNYILTNAKLYSYNLQPSHINSEYFFYLIT